MSLAVAAAVFPVIFIGELPDKTMFASLVMSTRGRPLMVWLGAAVAFALHVVIATTVGVALFHLVARRVVDAVVAATFLIGAVLAVREARHGGRSGSFAAGRAGGHGTVLTAFVVIFVAEWGDITQLLTVNLAARYHSPLSVGVGALLALCAVAALAVVGGRGLLRFVNVVTVRLVTAVVLVGLAGYASWSAFA
ncbi:MAG TPA: TMEM165/GDT1 family protein [Acidimicrobiales bacterium]|nr:TMEM165/GDT1 family protein [Acidimicrobiales bacterium]